jgi:23S rRNA (adenine2503-C2)-methyltransferase
MESGLTDLTGLSQNELEKFFEALGEPRFRAVQAMEWIHNKGVSSFDEMTNFSKALRVKLKDVAKVTSVEVLCEEVSKIDGTRKYLFGLDDGNTVESVLMFHDYGRSACISTQVGCKMGCGFCATSIGGFVRDLTCGEIMSQALYISRRLQGEGTRLSSIVFMGMGEPFDNYRNSIMAVRLLNYPKGLNIGYRHITISTCGIVPGIYALAGEGIPVTLAISLHAPNNELRNQLMPINRRYPIEELMEACRKYIKVTNRRVTFEYILIEGVNDSKKEIRELVRLLKGLLCHVNLIPMNLVQERRYRPAQEDAVERFSHALEGVGISTTLRREMGADIHGACGQLRRRTL